MSSTITALTSGGGLAMAGDTSGQLELKVNNGTTAVTVDTSGNMGIGESTPAGSAGYTQLVVRGSSGAELSLKGGTTQYGYVYVDSGGFRIINPQSGASSGTLQFSTSNTERMRIDSSGNVLIGTSSVGSTTSGGAIRWGQSGNAAMTAIYQAGVANGGTVDIAVGGGGAGTMCILQASNSASSNALLANRTIFAVMGRGTSFTFTSIGSQNGTSGGLGFSMSCPSNGVLRLTNTGGQNGDVVMTVYGTQAY